MFLDQRLDAFTLTLRRLALGRAFARFLGMLEIADQAAEIGHGEARFGRRDVPRTRRQGGGFFVVRLEMRVEIGNGAANHPEEHGFRLAGRRRVHSVHRVPPARV